MKKLFRSAVCGFAAAVIPLAAMAQESIPAVGIVNGSRLRTDLCEEVTPLSSTVQVATADLQERLWLPIFRDSRDAPNCPVIMQGAALMLEAGTSEIRELVLKPGSPESWLLTNVATTLIGQELISPTVSIDDSIFTMPLQASSNFALAGIWPLSDIPPDSLPDWDQYRNTEVNERLRKMAPRYLFLEITAADRFNNIRSRVGARPAGELCPAAFATSPTYEVEWVDVEWVSHERVWLTLVVHHQLDKICPLMDSYEWMLSEDANKRLPEAIAVDINEQIDEETTIYKRKMWTFPSLDNLVPQPAEVTWTASAVGGAILVYAVVGGAHRTGSLMMFVPLMQR